MILSLITLCVGALVIIGTTHLFGYVLRGIVEDTVEWYVRIGNKIRVYRKVWERKDVKEVHSIREQKENLVHLIQ
jgi:hypothetical protein